MFDSASALKSPRDIDRHFEGVHADKVGGLSPSAHWGSGAGGGGVSNL
jgi:hypothetical protein